MKREPLETPFPFVPTAFPGGTVRSPGETGDGGWGMARGAAAAVLSPEIPACSPWGSAFARQGMGRDRQGTARGGQGMPPAGRVAGFIDN